MKTKKFPEIITAIAIIGLLLATLLSACAGGAKPAAGANELDGTIREASDYLNGRIPKGNKVAFINISGGYPDLADYILGDLSKYGVNDGVFSVVDRALLDQVRAELNFQFSGEVSDQSAQEIGKMLGAQTIVSGSVRKIGSLYRLEVKAVEVQTAAIQGQWNKNIPQGMTIAALTENTSSGTAAASPSPAGAQRTQAATGGTGTTSGTAQASAGSKAAPAAPETLKAQLSATTAPQVGRYIFFPRPQVYKRGIPDREWLYQIIVRGRNMLVYVGDTQRGPSTTDLGGWEVSGTILTNLDNPSRTWGHIGGSRSSNFNEGGTVLSFENVTGYRFSLEHTYWSIIIENIDLSKAQFEPAE